MNEWGIDPVRCWHCGTPLTKRRRRYCSDACRKHTDRLAKGLLDPCRADEVAWTRNGILHYGRQNESEVFITLCGVKSTARNLLHTQAPKGLSAWLAAHGRPCAHCRRIRFSDPVG